MSSKKSHPGHRPRMTLKDIQESNRLRMIALSTGWTPDQIGGVIKRHPDTVRQWLGEKQLLPVECQELLKKHWSAETCGR